MEVGMYKYTPQDIAEILTDIDGYLLKHPEKTRNQIKTLQRYYLKQGTTVEKEPKPIANQTTVEQVGDNVVSTIEGWYEVVTKNAEGEAETHRLYKHSTKSRPNPMQYAEVFEPVTPAIIRPTRSKRIKTASEFILIHGDGQVDHRRIIDPITGDMKLLPLHDVPMHNVIKQFNAKFRPQTTVNLGDFADMAALSRFDPDSDHFHKTLGPSMRYIHDFYAQMVADNPDAHHVEVDSNHAARLKKQTLKNMSPLYDFVLPGEDYPLMTYYRLANLGKLGIDFISGYGNAEFVIEDSVRNPIIFKHGTHSSSSPGATVRKESLENPDISIIRGHGHSDEQIMTTRRDGSVLLYKQFGSSCINNGPVPGYHSAVDDHNLPVKYHNKKHQNSFGMMELFPDGTFNLETIVVINGIANYRGEHFNGNDGRTN